MNYINNDIKLILKNEIYYREYKKKKRKRKKKKERKRTTTIVYGINDWNVRTTINFTTKESKSNTKKRHRTRKIC